MLIMRLHVSKYQIVSWNKIYRALRFYYDNLDVKIAFEIFVMHGFLQTIFDMVFPTLMQTLTIIKMIYFILLY